MICAPQRQWHPEKHDARKEEDQGISFIGNGPNTVSGSTVSNTELSDFFLGAHWVPGSELSEFLSAYYLCAKANSPSFSRKTHRVFPKFLSEAQWVLFSETVLSKQYSATVAYFTSFPLFICAEQAQGRDSAHRNRGQQKGATSKATKIIKNFVETVDWLASCFSPYRAREATGAEIPEKWGKITKFPSPVRPPKMGKITPKKAVKLLRKYHLCNFSVIFPHFRGSDRSDKNHQKISASPKRGCLTQRAQRSKKIWSRSKFLISIDIFDLDVENFSLDVSISPQKIGPRWVARSKISFSLEMFNPDRNLECFWSLGPLGNVGAWNPQESGRKAALFCNAAISMLQCSFSLVAAQPLVQMTSALQKSECCSAVSAGQHSKNCSATSAFACGMLQAWGLEGWGLLPEYYRDSRLTLFDADRAGKQWHKSPTIVKTIFDTFRRFSRRTQFLAHLGSRDRKKWSFRKEVFSKMSIFERIERT